MINPFSTIIKKIKSKDKDLEGMYVAVDDAGNIIGFDMNLEIVVNMAGSYNERHFEEKKRIIQLKDIKTREKIRKCL